VLSSERTQTNERQNEADILPQTLVYSLSGEKEERVKRNMGSGWVCPIKKGTSAKSSLPFKLNRL
jgi:hypothetical protein